MPDLATIHLRAQTQRTFLPTTAQCFTGSMATTMAYTKDAKSSGPPARKKLKTSDLPLSSETRAAIQGLAHTFKKKGGYDSLRKLVWENLEGSVSTEVQSAPGNLG